MARGSNLKPFEGTEVIRVRGPKSLLKQLKRFSPSEVAAWVYHAERALQKHAPELTLEHSPAPIPAPPEEKPINARLAEILKNKKPVTAWDLNAMKNGLEFTEEEQQANERFWQEREAERQRERALMMRELEAEDL